MEPCLGTTSLIGLGGMFKPNVTMKIQLQDLFFQLTKQIITRQRNKTEEKVGSICLGGCVLIGVWLIACERFSRRHRIYSSWNSYQIDCWLWSAQSSFSIWLTLPRTFKASMAVPTMSRPSAFLTTCLSSSSHWWSTLSPPADTGTCSACGASKTPGVWTKSGDSSSGTAPVGVPQLARDKPRQMIQTLNKGHRHSGGFKSSEMDSPSECNISRCTQRTNFVQSISSRPKTGAQNAKDGKERRRRSRTQSLTIRTM